MLEEVCQANDMPDVKTILKWLADKNHIEFCDLYEKTLKMRTHLLADRTFLIASKRPKIVDKDGVEKTDSAGVTANNVEIINFRWYIQRLNRTLYGDRDTNAEGTGEKLSGIIEAEGNPPT